MSAIKPTDAVSQLCPNCGLCCNGVLFADVELRKGDDAKRLMKLGLSLERKGQGETRIRATMCVFRWKTLWNLRWPSKALPDV